MTRNEILSMEAGREMDALVAEKVMEWKLGTMSYKIPPDPNLACWHNDDWTSFRSLANWYPSTDIAAAWEVMEKIRAMGYWVAINTTCDAGLFDVQVMRNGLGSKVTAVVFQSAPLAICRAALLATMEINDPS